jgi:hypothetical protein
VYQLGPTSDLSVSIHHGLYLVCKAASVKSDLIRAWYKLVIDLCCYLHDCFG